MAKFERGQSGNPHGRPRGSSKVKVLQDALAKHRTDLLEKAVSMALDGDAVMLKCLLDRLLPVLRPIDADTGKAQEGSHVRIYLPKMDELPLDDEPVMTAAERAN